MEKLKSKGMDRLKMTLTVHTVCLDSTICTSFGKLFLTQIKDPVEMGPDVIIDWTAAGRLPVSMLTALLIMF